jgi:hypothetical protein
MTKSKSRVKSTKKNTEGEQNFSFGIALVTLLLVFGYFIQSAIEIYHQEPIKIAIERLTTDNNAKEKTSTEPKQSEH